MMQNPKKVTKSVKSDLRRTRDLLLPRLVSGEVGVEIGDN
jgi:hypothetical protein